MKLKENRKQKVQLEKFPETVLDKEKAHLMALAEKPFRERATAARQAAEKLKDVALAPTEQDAVRIYYDFVGVLDVESPHEPNKTYVLSESAIQANEDLEKAQQIASLVLSAVQKRDKSDKGMYEVRQQDIAIAAISWLREQNNTWVEAAIKEGDYVGNNYEQVDELAGGFK